MKETIKKVVRYLSEKPFIGGPIKIVVGIIRLPQIRDNIVQINRKLNAIRYVNEVQDIHLDHMRQEFDDVDEVRVQSIGEIQQRINEIIQRSEVQQTKLNEVNNHIEAIKHYLHAEIHAQISELSDQIELCGQQVNELKHHQDDFDTEYLPRFTEALEYNENLKRSLPVVLRQHRRSIARIGNR